MPQACLWNTLALRKANQQPWNAGVCRAWGASSRVGKFFLLNELFLPLSGRSAEPWLGSSASCLWKWPPFQLTCAGSSVCHLESGLSTKGRHEASFSGAGWIVTHCTSGADLYFSSLFCSCETERECHTCASQHTPTLLCWVSTLGRASCLMPRKQFVNLASLQPPSSLARNMRTWTAKHGQIDPQRPSCTCSCPPSPGPPPHCAPVHAACALTVWQSINAWDILTRSYLCMCRFFHQECTFLTPMWWPPT